ncbi:hypothetical protein [Vibrio crassostreae]|uniref:hypothetical protein n=2 Tax=Vibrio crassostreae TaxID=246167 RepID=UPI000F4AE553|nr:hypothetical protein [Vibrio crassostreae]ROP23256.1 hypothetical protein EDB33_103362 [Vibrio crassostreae]ROP23894.1 hypothetical protein EDB34_103362 [Vibrio crassostreae]RPE98522.1 hypothetical protein EDB15_1034 [Vibrio crassostreae]TCV11362.1 hypothetical protein EDB16_108245 [Vibrio crassostreae]TCV25450.1 hypothetical protein EDB11_103362 [Vibrio crassostreae]
MTNDLQLLALYENRKLMITMNYRIHGDVCGFSPSYVYAIANDLYPFFQSVHIPEENLIDPYYDCYRISENDISEVLNYIDEEWLKDRLYNFYDLETHFGGRGERGKLITILRYAYLDDRFNEALWSKMMEWAPSEAKSIVRDLAEWEI